MKIEIHQTNRIVTFIPEGEKDLFILGVLSAKIKGAIHYETEPPSHEVRCSIENLIALLVSQNL